MPRATVASPPPTSSTEWAVSDGTRLRFHWACFRLWAVEQHRVGAVPDAIRHILVLPGVLVSDLAMPGLDGYALIRWVRARPPESGGRIPAIAITAFSEDYDSRTAHEAGFDAYVRKPINLTSFCELVGRLATNPRPDRSR